LPSVQTVSVDLATDQFTIFYIAEQVSVAEMHEAIASLGYSPSTVRSAIEKDSTPSSDEIPEPVLSAISAAGDSGKLVFLDFQASWCGACKIMELTTFADASVQRTLRNFVFLKVDADNEAEATNYYGVVGLPTLVVLDSEGHERFRHVGPMGVEDLNLVLGKLISE